MMSRHAARNDIDLLPTELLARIFEHTLNDDHTTWDSFHAYHNLRDLALVSRRWNAVIQNTPSLFTSVGNNLLAPVLQHLLTRSKTHGLTVTYLEDKRADQKEFLELAAAHLERWQSFRLQICNGQTYEDLLRRPANRLERLMLRSEPLWRVHVVDYFGGRAERLEELHLEQAVTVRWDAPMLAGLRVLVIKLLVDKTPTLHQLLSVISKSIHLETLVIDWVNFPSTALDIPSGYRPLELKQLKTINLALEPDIANTLMQYILAPKCTDFKLDGTQTFPDQIEPEFIISAFEPILQTIIPTIKSLKVRLFENHFSCVAPGFVVKLRHPQPTAILIELSTTLYAYPRKTGFTLSIETDEPLTPPPLLEGAIKMLDSLTELEIRTTKALNRLVEPVLAHRIPFHGTYIWPLPNLRTLVLSMDDTSEAFDMEDVFKFIKARYSHGMIDENPPGYPVPLRVLDVRGVNKSRVGRAAFDRMRFELCTAGTRVLWDYDDVYPLPAGTVDDPIEVESWPID